VDVLTHERIIRLDLHPVCTPAEQTRWRWIAVADDPHPEGVAQGRLRYVAAYGEGKGSRSRLHLGDRSVHVLDDCGRLDPGVGTDDIYRPGAQQIMQRAVDYGHIQHNPMKIGREFRPVNGPMGNFSPSTELDDLTGDE
jgi:hypothetical protein